VDTREPDDTATYQTPVNGIMPLGFSPETRSKRSIQYPMVGQVLAIEMLFKQFTICAEKLNENQAYHLFTASVFSPQYSYDKSTIAIYSAQERMSFFKGYVSTINWALLIQGNLDKVEVALVSSENLLRYMTDELPVKNLTPLMVATVSIVDNVASWQIGQEVILPASLPQFARRLFSHLIRVACGDLTGSQAPPPIPEIVNREQTKLLLAWIST
jgi:hypothetical protein